MRCRAHSPSYQESYVAHEHHLATGWFSSRRLPWALAQQWRQKGPHSGEEIRIRGKVRQLETYSGHADGDELIEWILERQPIRHGLFLCHGEQQSSEALKADLIAKGLPEKMITVPAIDDEVHLKTKGVAEYAPNITHRVKQSDICGWDAHNEFAELQIDLKEAFDKLADEKARRALARRIKRALEAADES